MSSHDKSPKQMSIQELVHNIEHLQMRNEFLDLERLEAIQHRTEYDHDRTKFEMTLNNHRIALYGVTLAKKLRESGMLDQL